MERACPPSQPKRGSRRAPWRCRSRRRADADAASPPGRARRGRGPPRVRGAGRRNAAAGAPGAAPRGAATRSRRGVRDRSGGLAPVGVADRAERGRKRRRVRWRGTAPRAGRPWGTSVCSECGRPARPARRHTETSPAGWTARRRRGTAPRPSAGGHFTRQALHTADTSGRRARQAPRSSPPPGDGERSCRGAGAGEILPRLLRPPRVPGGVEKCT